MFTAVEYLAAKSLLLRILVIQGAPCTTCLVCTWVD